jgi:hypothetical protein
MHLLNYRLWHRIKPALAKRVAAEYAPERHQAAAQRAVTFHRFQGVCRAGGNKPAAGPPDGGYIIPVDPDQKKKNFFSYARLFVNRITAALFGKGLA